MRKTTLTSLLAALAIVLAAPPLGAASWEGTIKLGGIVLDEDGDLSTVQETHNIYDGFSISQIRLVGAPTPNNYLMLNLRDLNLDGRKGELLYRRPGAFKLTASYDQHRQVFDAQRETNSERRDWNFGAGWTPAKWLRLSGYLNVQNREGNRLSYPAGTVSVLGTAYDNQLVTGSLSAEARKDRRGIAVGFRASGFADDLNPVADRTGTVFSARLFGSGFLYDKLTHVLRGAYGVSKLTDASIDYTLANFQYTGVVRPLDRFQFQYNFDAQRVDNESTKLKTDRFQNNFDATFYYQDGTVTAGYGYETNDDDRSLTSYHSWRVGATLRGAWHSARVRYASREKKDTEARTLLEDMESSRFRGDLEILPAKDLALTAGLNVREREFPNIDVKSKGESVRTGARYSYPVWGNASATYTYSNDEYTDLADGYDVRSHVVTGRLDFERIKDLRLSTGLTYMEAGKDLDIEKSILFFEGAYTVQDDYHFEVKYNVYNYDDFVLLGRYYTANVVWFNVAYDFQVE
jgi:hypothetical protein